jgi:NAD(P)-dependent dehydrogenase (short-subunit alcohol dehydrogenase family)
MDERVCLVTGVGPGTGSAICRRFARGGFRVAMLARNAERLRELEVELPGARAFPCDVSDGDAVRETCGAIRDTLGAPEVVVYNATRGTFGNFLQSSAKDLEANFRVNTLGLLHVAQAVCPDMIEAGRGAFIVTGNTSARRGKANFAAFAPTKAAQRILSESMARELGPRGIHVAYVIIDATIDVPWTRRAFADRPEDFFADPDAIADTLFYLAGQPRSAWSFDVDLRPFGEEW